MARRNRIIFLAVGFGLLTAVASCSSNKKDVQHARHSVYDADFAFVYNTALDVTRDHYPTLNDNPGPGKISTAWHQVSYANNQDDLANQQTLANASGIPQTQQSMAGTGVAPTQSMTGVPTRLAYKRFFVRFDVSVTGGRPWRVKVVGHASEWDPGAAMPVEMRGASRPAWLDGRIESLEVAIYKRLKKVAQPMKEEAPLVAEDPKTDPTKFTGLPPAAAKHLAALKDSLAKRDYVALRPLLDDNVVWSLGGGTGADVAIATWQADPTTLESMNAAIDAGCAESADKKISCPAGAPQRGIYQLVLEQHGEWKVTSFVKAE